jgi:FkbM family methyltransferase
MRTIHRPIHVPKMARAWNWAAFVGDPHALKFAKRELDNLHAVIKRVPQKRVAVQAGGNQGIWPKYLALWFDRVITFEPDPANFFAMTMNAPEPNIVRHQAALGAAPGRVGLSQARRDDTKGPHHSGLVHVEGEGDVERIRLDDLNLAICDLLYLDVEGYELFALKGAVDTLARCRPVVAIEVNQNLRFFGLTPEDIDAFFAAHQYTHVATLAKNDRMYLPSERLC